MPAETVGCAIVVIGGGGAVTVRDDDGVFALFLPLRNTPIREVQI